MVLLDTIINYWWIILLVISLPYFSFFLISLKKIKSQKIVEEENSNLVISDEEKNLGISIKNSDIEVYKKRIEDLIISLSETKDKFSVNAVEAILIVELFSDSVLVNEYGELVIDVKTVNEFSKTIYHDPMKFISYIKSVETRIDINNPENKIELSSVLYMMRNARKFGLYIDDNTKESDVVYKIKSAIHESNYKDVVIKIVQDVELEKQSYIDNYTNVVLTNVSKSSAEDKEDTKSVENADENIESVEKLEDGKVKLTMKNGTTITKNDFIIYEVVSLEEQEAKESTKNQEQKNQRPTYLPKVSINSEKVQEYIGRFGVLDLHEESNKDKMIFKDRCLKFYDDSLFSYKSFKPEDFHTKSFFKQDEINFYHRFLSSLFTKEYAIENDKPFIFIGETTLKNGKIIRYVTISAFYFLAIVYFSIAREDREAFFHFIFNNKEIKEDNLNIFMENINKEIGLFHPTKDYFIFDAVYAYLDKTFYTKMLNINIATLGELLKNSDEVRESYSTIKQELDSKIHIKAFGEAAKKYNNASINYNHDTFFRVPLDERIF